MIEKKLTHRKIGSHSGVPSSATLEVWVCKYWCIVHLSTVLGSDYVYASVQFNLPYYSRRVLCKLNGAIMWIQR